MLAIRYDEKSFKLLFAETSVQNGGKKSMPEGWKRNLPGMRDDHRDDHEMQAHAAAEVWEGDQERGENAPERSYPASLCPKR